MAVTKIVARRYRVDTGINYVLNGDKTEDRRLTAFQYCGPNNAYACMMETKRETGKPDGVQCYHIVQAFKPGEISPELALDIAKSFVSEHLPGYETVIGVHVDKDHIHSHIVFNSVNREKIGDKPFIMHRKVIVTKVYSLFRLIQIRYTGETEEFFVDVCALTNEPDYTNSISLRLLGGNCGE